MAGLEIRLLGSFEVDLGGTVATGFESNKVRALLAYLAVESSRAHSREKLAAMFWSEMASRRAAPNLSRALYNLRHVIRDHQADPPFLLRSRSTIQFNPESDHRLDVKTILNHLEAAQNQDASLRMDDEQWLEELATAVQLYRGDFLEGLVFDSGLAFDEWVLVMGQRFLLLVLRGLSLLAETYAGRGEIGTAMPFAWRQVALDPLNEPACRQLMRLLAESGQRSQALTQFERLQVMLAEELSTVPEPETVALRDRIRGVDVPSRDRGSGDNLPAFIAPLIGRQDELKELLALIRASDRRLLTILGPGGSGKTRLALEATMSSRDTYRNGVYFVPLNAVQSIVSILPAIVDTLDLPRGEGYDHQEQLRNYLREKDLLLVLDGFEHLLDGAGTLAELLRDAPGLKIMVTSRARLNLKSEHLYLLSGMGYPLRDASVAEVLGSDAVQLLLFGLRRDQKDYQPGPDDLDSLLQVCRQVQGMPLGILLAGSWGRTFSVPEIAVRVSRSLDFLAADWTDVPARQRSMRATFDYTWDLLDDRERGIFQSLSVVRGAFTRQAARAISGASHHELRSLVDRSLLLNKTPGWYEVHELLRQYGREKLALSTREEQEVCGRHSAYYLDQLARMGVELKSKGQVAALSSIDLEHENYRAAWNWSASQGSIPDLDRGLDALCLYYELSVRYLDGEGACRVAREGLPQSPVDPKGILLQARIFIWLSRFTRLMGQPETASRLMEKAQAHVKKVKATGDQVQVVEAFINLEQGNIHFYKDRAAAAVCYQHSLELYRHLEDPWGAAKVLGSLGLHAYHAGSFDEAVRCYSESLDLYRDVGDPRGIANALVELGNNTLRQGQVSLGQQYIEEGIDIREQIGDRAVVARNIMDLGRSCFYSGQFAKGNAMYGKIFPILEDLGMRGELIYSMAGLSLGLSHNGEYAEAIAQEMKALPLAKEADAQREIGMGYLFLGIAYLGKGDFEQTQAWALKSIAKYQEIDQRDELAWALALMVYVQREMGQVSSAESYLYQTLEIGIKTHGYFPVLCGLYGAALLCLDQGEIEQAAEIAALVLRFPVAVNSRWFEDIAGREIAAAVEKLPPDVVAAAQERGRSLDLWETAEKLLEELASE